MKASSLPTKAQKEKDQVGENVKENSSVEILSVYGFIEWSANILGHSGPILYYFFLFAS